MTKLMLILRKYKLHVAITWWPRNWTVGRGNLWWCRALVAITTLGFTGLAGAGSIREVVNSNPELCHQFASILKATGMPNMSDAQLCKFHFDELQPALLKGFTFPHWTELKVADPLEMYKQMVLANWPSNVDLGAPPQAFFAGFDGMYKTYELLQQAANDRAIRFYTATVPARLWSGLSTNQAIMLKRLPAEFHFVKMDVDFCHNKEYRFLNGAYAASYRPGLRDPIDADELTDGVIALWHGSLLKIVTGPTWWFKLPSKGPLSIDATVSILHWQPSAEYSNLYKRPIRAGFSYGRTICTYSIETKERSSRNEQ